MRVPFIGRFLRRQDGAVAILSAAYGSIALVSVAAAADIGSVYLQSRKLQGMADLAAISAARDLGAADAAASATVDAGAWASPVEVDVTTGLYEHDPAKAAALRFTAGAAGPNAARVSLSADADLFFAQALLGKETLKINRRATAARAEFASFSIGTRLASLQGGAANVLIGALAGGQVSLTVMDYSALASADVDLFDYATALRTSAALDGASFDEALGANITPAKALSVLGDVLNADGQPTAGSAAKKISAGAVSLGQINLSHLFDLGPVGAQDRVISAKASSVKISAMDAADAVLLLAQEGRQVKLDFNTQFPGLANLDVWLAIGERPNNSPWLAMDDDGDVTIRTNQARLYVKARTLSALGILGVKPVTLPVLVEIASGEAKLADIDCPAQASLNKVTLAVKPSLGKVVIGDIDTTKLNDFTHDLTISPGTIADLSLVKVYGSAQVNLGGTTWQQVAFSQAEIEAGTLKSVKTNDIAQSTLVSLLGQTQVTAKVGGITIPSLGLSVLTSLKVLGSPLDGMINGLTELLGVRLGEADVQVHGLRCRDAALVS